MRLKLNNPCFSPYCCPAPVHPANADDGKVAAASALAPPPKSVKNWESLELDAFAETALELGEFNDCAPALPIASIAAPKRRLTRRVSDIQRGDDMSIPQ